MESLSNLSTLSLSPSHIVSEWVGLMVILLGLLTRAILLPYGFLILIFSSKILIIHLLFLPSLFHHIFFVYLYLFFIYRNHYFLCLHFSFFPSLIISTKSIAFCSVRISSFFSISFLFLYKI